uniref:Minor capsid protein P9 transmembrane helices domain-containing protein n=1 Tax=Marseillevirus LCMAC101 TaxID=2506602 RepID=A0A481YQM7_9VIRU|nr:MAG: hypothetical protein LCMAC101_00750 [Marseillevirus LCMAC101]
MGSNDVFWAKDPGVLFRSFAIFPTPDMTKNEKLNALTRLAIAVSIVMYFMEYQHWFIFLILSLLVIVILAYAGDSEAFTTKKMDSDSQSDKDLDVENGIEKFSVPATYLGTDFQQTVVSPTFSEEWQIPPPAYDLNVNTTFANDPNRFDTPMKPQSYPYGQYLTRTNLLPSDEYYTHLGCGGPNSARSYVNSTFLRNDLQFRDNMMRLYKKRLNRRFRNNGNDTFSPYNSF